MKYLYGNSSTSNLDQNYLEFLRLSLDFSIGVLQSETKIDGVLASIRDAEANAEMERNQVNEMAEKVNSLLDGATDSQSTAIAVALRENLRLSSGNEVTKALATIDSHLQSFIAQSNSEIAAERAANMTRIETVVLTCDFPKSQKRITISLDASGIYRAGLKTISDNLLHFQTALLIPRGNKFAEIIRIDSITPDLQIDIPEVGGWLKRGMKISPQKLSKEYVTAFRQQKDGTMISLRNAPKEGQAGFDILFKPEGVWISRISKQQESSDPFKVSEKDERILKELYATLHEAAIDISWNRKALVSAHVDQEPLSTYTEAEELVLWLLNHLTPIVQDISKNSLSPTELVLKRVLSDDRREEVFASKAELHEKLAVLTDAHKNYFAPLGLDRSNQEMDGLPEPKKTKIAVPEVSETAETTEMTAAQPRSEEPKIAELAPSADAPVVVASEKQTSDDEREDPTSELDLGDINEAAPMPIADKSSTIPPVRPSNVPPMRPSAGPPPRPSAGPPPRPSMPPSKPSAPPAKRDSIISPKK